MIKATEIKDKEALEAWLTDWPAAQGMSKDEAQQVCTTIAHRAALRVLALALEWFSGPDARERDLTALPLFWSVSISGGASTCPPPEMGSWGSAADSAVSAADSAAVSAADSAARSAFSAAVSAADSAAVSAAFSAFSAAVSAALLKETRRDAEWLEAGGSAITAPLWSGDIPPEITKAEARFIENLTADGPQWDFWLRWYDRAKASDPMPWQMIFDIARIDEDQWTGPDAPARIAEQIAEIEERHQIDQIISDNPLGQRIIRSDKTGLLSSETLVARDLQAVVDDIRRSLREFRANCKKERGNFGVAISAAFAPHIDELRQRLSKFKDNPRELLRSVEEAHRTFCLVAETEAAADHVQVDRLIHGLQDRAADIGLAAPEVMEEIKRRRAVKVQLMSDAQIAVALRLSVGMTADSEGVLKAAMSRALLTIVDHEASEADKAGAWTFVLGALPRGAKLKHEAGEAGANVSKDKSTMDVIVSYADKANKLDKGVDAVQEAIAEGGPWALDAYTQMMSGNLWGLFG